MPNRSMNHNSASLFQCSCAGTTKRRVQCYDVKLNKQSNFCPDHTKPEMKKQCDPPPNCEYMFYAENKKNSKNLKFVLGSCQGLQKYNQTTRDGEYELIVRSRKVKIYCHDMNTNKPKEYITLKGNEF